MYNVSIKIKEFLHWSRNEETHNHEKTRKSGSLLVEKVWFQNIFMDLQKLTPDNTQTHDCTRLNPIGLFKRNHKAILWKCNLKYSAGTGEAVMAESI